MPKVDKTDVKACLRCSSTDLEPMYGGIGFGLGIPPTNVRCRNCDFIGMPIILDNDKDYEKFLEQIKVIRYFSYQIWCRLL